MCIQRALQKRTSKDAVCVNGITDSMHQGRYRCFKGMKKKNVETEIQQQRATEMWLIALENGRL